MSLWDALLAGAGTATLTYFGGRHYEVPPDKLRQLTVFMGLFTFGSTVASEWLKDQVERTKQVSSDSADVVSNEPSAVTSLQNQGTPKPTESPSAPVAVNTPNAVNQGPSPKLSGWRRR